MEVILREDVPHLGNIGDIVRVKPGYARNYLLPRGLAVVADKRNVKRLEHERRVVAEKRERIVKAAQMIGPIRCYRDYEGNWCLDGAYATGKRIQQEARRLIREGLRERA